MKATHDQQSTIRQSAIRRRKTKDGHFTNRRRKAEAVKLVLKNGAEMC